MIPFTVREFNAVKTNEKLLSDSLHYHRMAPKNVEIEDFSSFSEQVISQLADGEDVDGWFLGTDLGVIADFDVLWFGDGILINLDLKHERTPDMNPRIIKKFQQQSRFIRLLNMEHLINITYVSSEKQMFIVKDNSLEKISFESLVQVLLKCQSSTSENLIANLSSKDYLVSPITDVEAFLNGEYWLTEDQERISESCMRPGVFGVQGEAGSGKTLIAYDLAKKLNKNKNVLFIFSGNLRSAHQILQNKLSSVDFISAKHVKDQELDKYDYVMVDEAQRLYEDSRKKVATWAEKNFESHTVIFFYDMKQALGRKDSGNHMHSLCVSFQKRKKGTIYQLKKGLRSNPSIHAFVRQVMSLEKKPPKDVGLENIRACVEVRYFKCAKDSFGWLESQIKQDYLFIVPTPSSYDESSSDAFKRYASDYKETHSVIGGEYDSVVTYLDESVSYDNKGHLQGSYKEYYHIMNESYVNMSRAKEHLALAIINNPDVYQAITEIVLNQNSFKPK
ncbi:MAG: DUF2075 domain-containing protein [Lactobacillus sp.]|nr:DUF2075 domain-containing protein [Lactobacillus sp.]